MIASPRSLRLAVIVVGLALVVSGLPATAAAPPVSKADPIDLDALFIGAHPDDELFSLTAFGQWDEYDDITSGVVTITRGEGGGNAVGTEEGPALGLIREAEERRATAYFGVENIYYLDKVDFYYNVSAPLTETAWGHDAILERVVRILRQTRPEIVVTMNPSPTPGNHGHHQYAARMAIEAFYAAADPAAFPRQISREKLQPWRVKKVFLGGIGVNTAAAAALGELEGIDGLLGDLLPEVTSPAGSGDCVSLGGEDPTEVTYSVASTRVSQRHGKPWGAVLGDAAKEYASQGFASTENQALLAALGAALCNVFIQVDGRVPFTADRDGPTAIFEGALYPADGGLPLGTELYLSTDRFRVVANEPFQVAALAGETANLDGSSVSLQLPEGWTATGDGALAPGPDEQWTTTFSVTPAADAAPGRVRIGATLTTDAGTATTLRVVEVVPPVRGSLQPLPHVAEFRAWAAGAGAPQLDSLIKDRAAIAVGETRTVRIDLVNYSAETQSGAVSLGLPAGFSAEPAEQPYEGLVSGATTSVSFEVTNTDPSLATSNEGGDAGDYNFTVVTQSSGGTATVEEALNLVPMTTIPEAAAAPTLDGVESPDEYTGEALDLSRLWEGTDPTGPDDASGSAKVTRVGDTLYFFVNVRDDTLGTVLPPEDCKRHWRTDSVEITLDPRGDSENTSTTFKTGIFPITDDPENGDPPCWQRDADNQQGPGPETAPGMTVASTVSDPYAGYALEARIDLADLPGSVDPSSMGLNLFIYDSDTQDRTGQTRLGWSTWGGVQGDPYRWGRAALPGYAPVALGPVAPLLDFEVAQSVRSPQSILQTAGDGVALSGDPRARSRFAAPRVTVDGTTLRVSLKARQGGRAWLFAWTGDHAAAAAELRLRPKRRKAVTMQVDPADMETLLAQGHLLVSFRVRPKVGIGTRSFDVPLSG